MPTKPLTPPMECLNNLEAQEGVDIETTGIHGMLVSVIYRSYLDLGSHEPSVKREAEHFFRSKLSHGEPPFFTFIQICEELNLDPDLLLNAVRQKCPHFDFEPVPEPKRGSSNFALRIYPGRRWKGWS